MGSHPDAFLVEMSFIIFSNHLNTPVSSMCRTRFMFSVKRSLPILVCIVHTADLLLLLSS